MPRPTDNVDQAFERLYDDLKALSRRMMAREAAGHTLQPTGLLNEVYLRMRSAQGLHWNDDAHFRALVALNATRVLCSHGRRHSAQKRQVDPFDAMEADLATAQTLEKQDVLELDRALEALAVEHRQGPYLRRLVLWIDVFGLTQIEAAALLDRSDRTIREHLGLAHLFLRRTLTRGAGC